MKCKLVPFLIFCAVIVSETIASAQGDSGSNNVDFDQSLKLPGYQEHTAQPQENSAQPQEVKQQTPYVSSKRLFVCAKLKKSFYKHVGRKKYTFSKGETFKVIDKKIKKNSKGKSITEYYIQFSDTKIPITKSRIWLGLSKVCALVGKKVLLKKPTLGYSIVTSKKQSEAKV